MMYKSVMDIDGHGRALYAPLPFKAIKNMEFDGATVNDPGDYTGGTGNPATLFTVTGDVLVYIMGLCKVSLVGGATLEAGLSGNNAVLLPQLADVSTDLLIGMTWLSASAEIGEGEAPVFHPIAAGNDIIQVVGTANITAGEVDYYCFWRPLSSDGLVVRA